MAEALLPTFGCQGLVEFFGVMATAIFEAAGFSVGFVVGPTTGHSIALVQFMQKHIAPLFFFDSIVNPYFIFGHEFINIVVTAFCKVDIKNTSNKTAVDDPDADAILKLFP